MAVVTDLIQTYDQSTSADIWIAEAIHMISPSETKFQLMLPKIQVGETKAEWIEDELVGQKTTLLTTNSATDQNTITIAASGTSMVPSDVATYQTVIRIDQEYMLVTAMNANVLTVTKGYASTTAATHAANAPVHIVSVLEHEGASGKKSWTMARTRPANYVQTFSRVIEVTGVQEAIKKLGGITSEVDYQIMKAMKQLALELEKTLILGVKAQAGDGASTFRTMGGLWSMISTNRTSNSSAVVSTDAIEADIRAIWDAGGTPRAIVTTGKIAQDIANLYESRITTDINTTIGGVAVTSIVNPLGDGPIAIIPHRAVPAGEYYMLDTSKLGLGYIRPFFRKDLAETGDSTKLWIGGDYTLELMNETAHVYRYAISET